MPEAGRRDSLGYGEPLARPGRIVSDPTGRWGIPSQLSRPRSAAPLVRRPRPGADGMPIAQSVLSVRGCRCSLALESLERKVRCPMNPSLYEQLGGEAAVDAAVDHFYGKVLADDRIRHFFDGVDMEQQARKQKAFLTVAFGGPNHYSGRAMRAAHRKFVEQGLSDLHFDAVVENLAATLTEMGVAPGLVKQVGEVAETTRDDVLGR